MAQRIRKTPLSPASKRARGDIERLRKRYGIRGILFRRSDFNRDYLRICRANARDYRRSRLLASALTALKHADVSSFPVVDNIIGDEWKPFRVERCVTGSIRGDICGDRFTATTTPNMLDSSSVIFLQNAAGETMRALIPSPMAAKEMLAQSVKHWRADAGYKYDGYTNYYDAHQDTHVSLVVHEFAMSENWTRTLTHPEVIDTIDASCQKPEHERPIIRLSGALIQKGVVLATVIGVGGERQTFVPTGFFTALTSAMQRAIPNATRPRLTAA